MSRTFERCTLWIVDRPVWTLLLLIGITGFAVMGYVDPDRVTRLFSGEDAPSTQSASLEEEFERPPDVDPFSIADAHAIVVVESDSFFTPQGTAAMRQVVEHLESLDHVSSVVWMDRVPMLNIFGLREPLLPHSKASPERFARAREKALQHPLVAGQFLSADAQTLVLLVNFDFFFITDDRDCVEGLREQAELAAAQFPGVAIEFSVTGRVPMYLTAMHSHDRNKYKYQIIGYGMIVLMSLILFRGVTAVAIVALAPCLGVFWTLGILGYFELKHNPFNDVILPVLLSLVGLTDGVHMMVQIRRLRAAGQSPLAAARSGIQQVGLACGLTSLTTAIGFGSLSLAHHEIVQEFGWCCVIGVVLTFIAVITSIPLACSTRLGQRVHIGHERGLIDRNLNRIGGVVDYVLTRQGLFARMGIAVTVVFALITLTLRPDERNSNALPDHSEPALALKKMDKALGGLEFAEVDIRWSKEVAADDREVLEVVGKVDQILRSEELIGHPLSVRNLIDALPGDGAAEDRMSMLELLPPPLKRAFYTPEYRQATVNFRVQDLGIARYGPVFDRVQAGIDQVKLAHPDFSLELEGSAVWRSRHLYRVVLDLVKSLGTASFIIFIVLTIVYRSVRMGLISIIPNIFPLSVSGVFLAVTGQSLELVSVCAFTICLGIAVDDTIHFLTRFEEERRRTKDLEEAIRRSFTGVGTALIMTTVVLVAGFSTVLFSDSRDHRLFAWMGGITLAAALFGDLIFLPALLARFAAKSKPSDGVDAEGDAVTLAAEVADSAHDVPAPQIQRSGRRQDHQPSHP